MYIVFSRYNISKEINNIKKIFKRKLFNMKKTQ